MSTPSWDKDAEEEHAQDILDKALSKKVLTRKALNNAFEYVYKDNAQKLAEALKNRKTMTQHIIQGHFLDVKQYIDSGYDLFSKGAGGESVVHIAAISKKPVPMLKLLLDSGAPIDAMDNNSKTPLMLSLEYLIGVGAYPKEIWEASNYLLDRGALLLPHSLGLLPHNVLEDRMKDLLLHRFGKEDVTEYEKREYLNEHGPQKLLSYFGSQQLYYRIWELEDTYMRTLHFKSYASNQILELTLDERASIRLLKEYVKYWFLKSSTEGDVDLLVKQLKGKPNRVLDPNKTIKEEDLTEDTTITIIPRLKTYANVWNGGRRHTRKARK